MIEQSKSGILLLEKRLTVLQII